jgi:hypothetical protein
MEEMAKALVSVPEMSSELKRISTDPNLLAKPVIPVVETPVEPRQERRSDALTAVHRATPTDRLSTADREERRLSSFTTIERKVSNGFMRGRGKIAIAGFVTALIASAVVALFGGRLFARSASPLAKVTDNFQTFSLDQSLSSATRDALVSSAQAKDVEGIQQREINGLTRADRSEPSASGRSQVSSAPNESSARSIGGLSGFEATSSDKERPIRAPTAENQPASLVKARGVTQPSNERKTATASARIQRPASDLKIPEIFR